MLLPHPERFLTACEYEAVSLENALGDELFLALHLVMKGCNGYMGHLKHYHREQEVSLGDRSLKYMRELKMCKLKDYSMVPSPEEIRAIVADCVTASPAFAEYFIRKVFVVEKKDLPSERNNIAVLKRIKKLPHLTRGRERAKALREILKMPASAVGACHSFHNSDLLMHVAMRQFGIALLVVYNDDPISDRWPYQTPNYLNEMGSRVFLPLTLGLIYIPKDGNLVILRKLCTDRAAPSYLGKKACYQGYALEMKGDIRTSHVNLLMMGVFDLSYTAFADYILKPMNTQRGQGKLPRKSDYRYASYGELVKLKKNWDLYQDFLQDQGRAARE
jgi:hypothetical protein